MKKILLILVLLVVLVIAGVIGLVAFGISQIDNLAKEAIERGSTYATGVDTTVDTVDIGLTSGTFAMSGFNLANPDGYDAPHFFNLSGTDVAFDTSSIGSDIITIPTVTLEGIEVYLDKSGGDGNYQVILDNLKRFESSDADASASGSGPQIVIESLVIDGVTTHVTGVPGLSAVAGDVTVDVPRVELTNVGAQEGGMTAPELVTLVVKTVLAASIESGGGIIPADMLTDLQGGLSQLVSLDSLGIEALGDLGDLGSLGGAVQEQVDQAINDVTDQAQDAMDNATDKATDAVKGLFGGGDDDGP